MSDKVTVSMKIGNNDDSANDIVSDYLKKVTLYNSNSNDSYYVDVTHFYYIQNIIMYMVIVTIQLLKYVSHQMTF